MAGEWIKVRTALNSDPRLRRAARRCKVPIAHAAGGVLLLWSMADTYTTDGQSIPMRAEDLDADTEIEGFSAALVEVDWLTINEDGTLSIPRFEEHNGESAKKRAQAAKRASKSRSRAQERDESARERDGSVTGAHLEPEPEPDVKSGSGRRALAPAASGPPLKGGRRGGDAGAASDAALRAAVAKREREEAETEADRRERRARLDGLEQRWGETLDELDDEQLTALVRRSGPFVMRQCEYAEQPRGDPAVRGLLLKQLSREEPAREEVA